MGLVPVLLLVAPNKPPVDPNNPVVDGFGFVGAPNNPPVVLDAPNNPPDGWFEVEVVELNNPLVLLPNKPAFWFVLPTKFAPPKNQIN